MVVFGCLLLGTYIGMLYKKRLEELRELERIINFIKGEIKYKHSILCEAFFNASQRCKSPFDLWLLDLNEKLKSNNKEQDFSVIWEESLSYLKNSACLKAIDYKELIAVGQALANQDIVSQERALSYEQEIIHSRVSELDKGISDKIRISVVLSTLGGVLIVVMLL